MTQDNTMTRHLKRHGWKYASIASLAGLTAINWSVLKAALCALLCSAPQ